MKMNVKALSTRKATTADGTVTMPISEYNKLLKRLSNFEAALRVDYTCEEWKGHKSHNVRVRFDLETLKEVMLDKMAAIPGEQLAVFEGQEINFTDRSYNYATLLSKDEEAQEEKTEVSG